MASNNQNNKSQQKRPKTTNNCFLACFGLSHPKTNNTTSYKKKPKKSGLRKKKSFFKFFWPKLKVITVDNNNKKKKNFKFDANKAAALKASHDIMLEATKVHHPQLKMVDHNASKSIAKEPNVLPKERKHQSRIQSQSYYATCHTEDNMASNKATMAKQSLLANKATKDSLIGASIMVAMLIIMSIWGRLCAILCMCAWLYCVPFIRGDSKEVITSSNIDTNTKMDIDFNSELYKKKVVLDGLLQRDHQNAVGIS